MAETTTEGERDLKRVLGIREGLAILVGSIIGVGILRTPGLVAGYMGDAGSIMGVWLLGAVVAWLSTLLLSEMTSTFPEAGGKYVYIKKAFGPTAGFVAGWSEFAGSRAFTAAAKAVVIAEYVILLAGRGSVPILALGVILAFAMVHVGGIKVGTVFQNWTTVLKVLILAGIAAAGLSAGEARGFTTSFTPETGRLLGFAISYQLVAFTFYGWEDAAKMAEEVRDPGRSLPWILLGGSAIVAFVYLLIIASFLSALTPAEMADSQVLVAQSAVASVFGERAGLFMVIAGILIIMSTLNVNFLGMPRVAFALARDRMAPRAFTRVSKRGTPVPALLFATAIVLLLAVTGGFELLIRFQMLIAISIDTVMFLGYFRLRKLYPTVERPLRVPFYPWLPLITVVLYVLILAVILYTQPELALGGGLIMGGFLVAGIITTRRRQTATVGVS